MQKFLEKFKIENIKIKLKAGQGKKGEKKKSFKSHIPFRLNFLFFIIFALFVALIGQLGYLQIVNGDSIKSQLKQSSTIKIKGTTPRGSIYDATGKVLAGTKANPAITFTRGNKMTSDELLAIANKINELIDVPVDSKLKERDRKDYFLASKANRELVNKRLTPKQREETDTSKAYANQVEKVTPEDINYDAKTLQAVTIFTRMNSASALNTVFIKNEGVTDNELAVIGEHASELSGVSTGTDWSREYSVDDESLRSIIGTVSNNGLPADDLEKYLAKGYARNDRVGMSYLEKQYEDVLQGTKSQSEITLDNSGNITKQKQVYEGEKGSNLVLTINTEFQKRMEEIIKSHYQGLISSGKAQYSPGIYGVTLNPKTGAVLGMVGYYHEEGSNEIEERSIGTFIDSFEPGSVIKVATITAGYQNGVLNGNEVLLDQPILIQGSAAKASIYNKDGSGNRSINTQKALEISSNSYMMQIALKLLNVQYVPRMGMPYLKNQTKAYDELRKAFAEYGLGTKTGLDLPKEETGVSTPVKDLSDNNGDGGKILDLSFGQFDTYTTMQLAQYAATIANNGQRIEPHVVQGIYGNDDNGNLGSLKKSIQPKVLNTVSLTDEQNAIIKAGLYDVVHGNDPFTTGTILQGSKINASAKTGTAEREVYKDGQKVADVVNSNIIAYGPSEDAEVAFALMMPNLKDDDGHVNVTIAKEVLDAYHDMYMQ